MEVSGVLAGERVYTVPEAAAQAGVVVPTIYRWIAAGKLPGAYLHYGSRRLGYRIPHSAIVTLRMGGRIDGTR